MTRSAREYTVHEVSRLLGVTEPSLRYAIGAGQLPVIRRLGRVRVTEDGIQEFIRKRDQ
jgi:excisionase family DNA binding protein